MSNYVYNVPPPYQQAGTAAQGPQSGQYNYQQPQSSSVLGGPPGGITSGTSGVPTNTAGNQYQYQAPPPVPPPPTSFNSPSPPQGQWGNPPSSQRQSWKPPPPPPSAPPAPAATYNPGTYGPMPGGQQAPNSPTRFNQNSQNNQGQGYGYGSVPPQSTTAPPQQQYQYQPPSSQQWSQQQGPSLGQNASDQQQRPPPPLPPRPASAISNNRPGSVIYAPQGRLHSSPVQTNIQLPQQTQTPQQHQPPFTAPGSLSQNAQPQQQQTEYHGQYQNQNQAPVPPPPKPQGYQQGGAQNQQAQVPYSNQLQTQDYNSQLQGQTNQQYNQPQSQTQFQQQPSQYGQYDASAPPLPSKISDGSYFPPVAQQTQQVQNNSQQYPANAGNPATDAWITSPGETQPVYVPPSLSGQGVSAYQPNNANPQPGVYIPPPPENVPAWSQQQHAPLAAPPGSKRFKYTPPVLHPDYQPGGSKYNPQQAIQPAQPYQSDPVPQQQQPQEWNPQPIVTQYPGQPGVEGWNQQVGGWQSASHGSVHPPPEPQAPWGQQQEPPQEQNYQSQQVQLHQQPSQGQFHQQQQNWGEHQVQHPLQNQDHYHHTQQSPEQLQPAHVVPSDNHSQNQQPQHQPHVSLSQAYENEHRHDVQHPIVTASPVQTTVPPPNQDPNVGRNSGEEKDTSKPLTSSNVLSASALGLGGPGDWEHFGMSAEDESVDDTALTTKKEDLVSPPQNTMVELPSTSSPNLSSKEQSKIIRQDFHKPETWPTPPAPAPLTLNRPVSALTSTVQDGGRYAPTPPPNDRPTYPHPERAVSIVSVEDNDQGDGIDGAIQAWSRQQSQLASQQQYEAEAQHASRPPEGSQSFTVGDGGWPNSTQQIESTGEQRSQTPTQAQFSQQQRPQEGTKSNILASTGQSFAVDDGTSDQHQQHGPGGRASTSTPISQPLQPLSETQPEKKASTSIPTASQSFVMDGGGWPGPAQDHEPVASTQTFEKPHALVQTKPVPAVSQSFVVDDGGWSVQAQQSNSSTKAPSPKQPPVQGTIQPASASHTSFIMDAGPPLSQPLQHSDSAPSNTTQPQLDSKRHVEPEPLSLYPNLDPWYKASLERYAAMVNAESLAATDEERTRLFTDFMIEESRLRGVRYGVGIGPRDDGKRNGSGSKPSIEQATAISPQRGRQMPKSVSTDIQTTVDDIEYSPGGRPRLRSQSATGARGAKDTVVSNLRGESARRSTQPKATTPPQKFAAASPPKQIEPPLSPGSNAPIPIESNQPGPSRTVVHAPSSPPAKPGNKPSPITPGSPKSVGPAPEKPVYIPFRPQGAEGLKISESPYKPYMPPPSVAENKNYKPTPATADGTPSQPTYLPFMPIDTGSGANNAHGPTLQRQTSLDSAPQKSKARTTNEQIGKLPQEDSNGKAAAYSKAAAPPPRRRDTTDVVHVRDKVGVFKREHAEALVSPPTERESSIPKQARDLVAGLERILPSNRGLKADGSIYIVPIEKCMDALPDDLNFISDAIAAWEVKAKKVRETHDRERRIRQEEQEEHTDQLFSEKQIGYGDISALEEDFKLSEREKKSKEDKEEYETFANEVFVRSYDHFQEEIKQLMDKYVDCIDLMKDAIAGKEALEAHNDKPNLSQIMAIYVALHKKIELRHEAVCQVIAERDKRFKKTVIQPLYSAGNIPEVKKMEKHFDEADKKSALEASKKKDQRAKRLMRSVEENTMNTLREDLNYMDKITQEVHKILQMLPPSTSGDYSGVAQALSNELVFSQTILKTLAGKSEALMQSFHAAGLEISKAEYDVSYASARLNNEPPDALNRLREDMLKENERLSKELDHRISVVRGDFQKADEEILTLLPRLENLRAPSSTNEQRSPEAGDPEYDMRMKKALEAAKKRNAGRSGNPDLS
ncbi:hypothetical protein FGG08_006446 [Glutinoglossum americanum]|uniref:Uncharacterized protein n=1 Tax=Glutinoglossum americanum TaxID=1670608 RepID=A0A9P8HW16_9PEZI|nr:hypothetical protein FGG08_006446 [Glutinoglossum americanum]